MSHKFSRSARLLVLPFFRKSGAISLWSWQPVSSFLQGRAQNGYAVHGTDTAVAVCVVGDSSSLHFVVILDLSVFQASCLPQSFVQPIRPSLYPTRHDYLVHYHLSLSLGPGGQARRKP